MFGRRYSTPLSKTEFEVKTALFLENRYIFTPNRDSLKNIMFQWSRMCTHCKLEFPPATTQI